MLSQTEVSESSSCNPAPLAKALNGLHLALLASACVVINVLPATAQSQPEPHRIDQPATTNGQLEDIVVTASEDEPVGWQGAPEWAYETPRSVSVIGREEIKNQNVRTAADLFDSMPGVAVADNPQDPGISINIRGLQDFNRVNVMIDGARQNFQKAGHDEVGRVYVDPAFIKQVEVEKSATSGLGGAGAIGGTVNFRSLNADDLVESDNRYGIEGKLAAGTNAYNFNGNIAAGIRLTDNISFAAGFSKKSLGEYKEGKNGTIEVVDRPLPGSTEPMVFTGSEALSWITKLDIDLADDQELSVGMVGFFDDFTISTRDGGYPNNSKLLNLTGTATYSWQPVDDLIDFEAQLWANRTHNDQYRLPRSAFYEGFHNDILMSSFGGSLQNTSVFELSDALLSWNYGLEAFRDVGTRKTVADDITDDPNDIWFGSDPNGTRNVFSAFQELTGSYNDWLQISYGLRYDLFNLNGVSTTYEGKDSSRKRIYSEKHYSNTGQNFAPTYGIAITPYEGMQFFGNYSKGYRIPTIIETFLGGQHVGGGGNFIPNQDLRPEAVQTWEAGVNLSMDETFLSDDRIRLKLSYFSRNIEDFVAQAPVLKLETSDIPNQYVNLLDAVKTEGIELEAVYDAGRFYGGLALSRTYTNMPEKARYAGQPPTYFGYTGDIDNVVLVNAAPKTKLSVDAGVRLLDENLNLGGRLTYVEVDKQFGQFGNGYPAKDYTVIDLFGSYKFNENATLRVDANNLADVAYIDALTASAYTSPGRTVTASLNFNF